MTQTQGAATFIMLEGGTEGDLALYAEAFGGDWVAGLVARREGDLGQATGRSCTRPPSSRATASWWWTRGSPMRSA